MNRQSGLVELQASPLEVLTDGLEFQWIFDGRGIAFYAQHTARHVVDAWFNKIVEVAQAWQSDKPLIVLNDFSGKDCAVTPYNQEKNRDLQRMFPNFPTISALVVKQNLTMQLSRLFVRMTARNQTRVHITFSLDEALLWLKEQMDSQA